MWGIKKTLLFLIFVFNIINVQASPVWKPAPAPKWFVNLSEATMLRLLDIGMTDYTYGIVPNFAITDEQKVMISKYGYIWLPTFNDDNNNDILIRMKDKQINRYVQIRVCKSWL